jgi:protein-tyrosine phosphatase
MSAKKILFLCTGNYYRSRFAEELFNHLAYEKGLNWSAESRGLVENLWLLGNFGAISPYALKELEKRSIKVSKTRFPQKLERHEAKGYRLLIALDRDEHEPLIRESYPELANVIYWDIKDLGEEPSESAMGRVEAKINALIAEISGKTD